MKIKKNLPFTDMIIVDDAETIRALSADEKIDRQFTFNFLANRFFLKRVLKNLSYKGARFPHLLPKKNILRQERHTALWNLFNANAITMAEGPEELEAIAAWIRHESPEQDPGILTQQLIGEFFNPLFKANAESWEAALLFHEDAISTNVVKRVWWRLTGKVNQAKKVLGSVTHEDIVAMHGIGVAVHNLVASIHKLRLLYDDPGRRKNLSAQQAVDLSLSAPPVVYRQALSNGAANGCPYSRFTLVLLKLKDANKDNQAKDLIFMSGAWSRCPAEQWIPAVIAGIWTRVANTALESA